MAMKAADIPTTTDMGSTFVTQKSFDDFKAANERQVYVSLALQCLFFAMTIVLQYFFFALTTIEFEQDRIGRNR